MKRIYIASHGALAEGIKNSLQLIAGSMSDQIITYSLTPGKSATDFMEQIEQELQSTPEDQFIIMGDLYGASVVNAMLHLTKYENAILLAGVNLSMALQVVLDSSEKISDETVDFIIQESKNGIQRLNALPEDNTIEDF
ncbi:PTS sugar transporter subunit IIA [Candidatus Enterococcus mansonii]|uniref:PTS EIIA type-4 domain-containing protein n=1 Tax=Candidatus Enterococcus mansonii TaxID=1834181 RepID=A0A242CDV7_9ENTE|nr:PTS fructose IIA subunit family protein [Enterococcus sp. 4G2_DIV0659]OTO07962.1 hypothetical protein A5880_002232 [Enterococcus sp. 4G2_DIV0659]